MEVPRQEQFVIPAPYRVWCHRCEKGFMSIEEAQQHERENMRVHQLADEERKNK